MNGRTNVTNSGNNIDVMEVPLDPVTNFVTEEGTGKVLLSWTDPLDKYATPEGATAQDPQQLVSVWSHTVIVRKEGSDPVDENDGVVVLSSSVRNQYQSTQYTDSNVENGIEYHYGAFAINEDGIASTGVYSNATPRVYDTVLANNTWTQIDEACSLGIAESFWEVGDEKSFTINDELYTAVILDFNHDDLSDGSGKAVITFSLKGLMAEKKQMNSDSIRSTNWSYPNFSNTLKPYIENTIYTGLQNDIKAYIQNVNREYGYGGSFYGTTTTTAYLFPFTAVEVGFSKPDSHSTCRDGTKYPYFSSNANRTKTFPDGTSGEWWLGSGEVRNMYDSYDTAYAYCVSSTGSSTIEHVTDTHGICFGFCIGKSTA